jgi:phosphoglycerate kinase
MMQGIQTAKDLAGKRVLVRIDADAPIENGVVVNPFRLKALIPTLTFLRDAKAQVILLGHLGRDGASMQPIYNELSKDVTLSFVDDIFGAEAQSALEGLADGELLLLGNIRTEAGELLNDDALANRLASLADIYVNEAFAVCHRAHASVVGVPKYLPHYAGIQLQKEVEALSGARDPKSPSLFILGGAKFETKLPLIEAFVGRYDHVFVGGALSNNFFKAQGLNIGDSLISGDEINISQLIQNEKILLPIDVVVKHEDLVRTTTPDALSAGDRISDAGPETISMLKEKIAQSKCILWNGPLGEYTHGFAEGTNSLAEVIASATGETILGGGDTSAAIADLHLEGKYSFLSTGGGAMLEFLLNGTLPGIEVLH